MSESRAVRWGMLIEADRCTGCYSCHLACRDEHAGNEHLPVAAAQPATGGAWIRIRDSERGSFPKVRVSYVAVPCLHCADAPCMAAAPEAIARRADGIVLIDPEKARGRRDLASACPYGAIAWNEEKQLPQKCTFCAHLLDQGWKQPRCVEACPTQALSFGNLNDERSAVSMRLREVESEQLAPARPAQPAVVYKGLPKPFVAGEIAFADRPAQPASGVAVSLARNGSRVDAHSDAFGDFEFNGLPSEGEYVLSVSHAGYKPREIALKAGTGINLGTVVLEPQG